MHRSSLKGKHAPPPTAIHPHMPHAKKRTPFRMQFWLNKLQGLAQVKSGLIIIDTHTPDPTHPDPRTRTQFAWKSIFGGDKRQAISAAQTTKGNGRQKPRPQRDFKVTSRISRPLSCLKTAGQGEWAVWMA